MRFMVLVKASPESEAGILPSEEVLAAMAKYNEELVRAGVDTIGQPRTILAGVTWSSAPR